MRAHNCSYSHHHRYRHHVAGSKQLDPLLGDHQAGNKMFPVIAMCAGVVLISTLIYRCDAHCALLVASLMHCTTIVSLPRSAVNFVIPEWFASSGIVGQGARCGGGSGGGGTHTLWGSRGG